MKLPSILSTLAVLGITSGCGSIVAYEGTGPITIVGKSAPAIKIPKKRKAALSEKKIEISEKVQFEKDRATILSASDELLSDVAEIMKENPDIKKLSIEGHASSDGDDGHNLQLSDARAKAVMAYLVTKGVAADRMSAQGFGEKKPIGDNNTEEGREKNRRVEFNVTERSAK